MGYFQDRAGKQLESMLDLSKYDESQLISIKVPASHLSGYTLLGKFERVNGEIEIRGVQYKYVKKRFYNDSLEFICIADHATAKWQQAKNEFFKQSADLQPMTHGKESAPQTRSVKLFIPDYYSPDYSFVLACPAIITGSGNSDRETILPEISLLTAGQPPEMLA